MARSNDQLRRLQQRLDGLPIAVRAALQPVLDKSAAELVALAKALAPVDHGDLKDSIHAEEGEHELARKIVAGDHEAPYARWVEFGTVDTPSQGFLFPAYRTRRDRIKRRLDRAALKAAKDYWNAR